MNLCAGFARGMDNPPACKQNPRSPSKGTSVPIVGIGLHLVIAAFFAVHAVRSGQDRYWLYALFGFPLLGSVVYALAIWLPSMRHHRGARRVASGIRARLDPGRELRESYEALEHSPTLDHRLRYADALAAAGRATDAVAQFRACASGQHGDNPDLQVRLAAALLDNGEAVAAIELLDRLIREQPGYKSPNGHLLYARALVAANERERARVEFDALVGYFVGYEARARYADALLEWGEGESAQRLARESLVHIRRLPRYAQRANQQWIDRLKWHATAAARPG